MAFGGHAHQKCVPGIVNFRVGKLGLIGDLSDMIPEFRLTDSSPVHFREYFILCVMAEETIRISNAQVDPRLPVPVKIECKNNVAVIEYDVFNVLHKWAILQQIFKNDGRFGTSRSRFQFYQPIGKSAGDVKGRYTNTLCL